MCGIKWAEYFINTSEVAEEDIEMTLVSPLLCPPVCAAIQFSCHIFATWISAKGTNTVYSGQWYSAVPRTLI